MGALTEATVRAALLHCYDPELPCNIVDLGLVLDVTLLEDLHAPGAGIPGVPPSFLARIILIPAHADATAETSLRAQITNRIAGLEGISEVSVEFRTHPSWSPNHISARGRRTLGLAGNPSLVQISS